MTLESAIRHLRPNAAWTLRGNSYAGLEWQDAQQTKPTEEEVAAAMLLPEPVPVPESVSLRQFRMALKRVGLFAAVDSLRTNPALTLQQRDDLTEFLEFSNQIERSHPLIASLSPMVGTTPSQIDDLFRLADTL
jgi:hypothetical protein